MTQLRKDGFNDNLGDAIRYEAEMHGWRASHPHEPGGGYRMYSVVLEIQNAAGMNTLGHVEADKHIHNICEIIKRHAGETRLPFHVAHRPGESGFRVYMLAAATPEQIADFMHRITRDVEHYSQSQPDLRDLRHPRRGGENAAEYSGVQVVAATTDLSSTAILNAYEAYARKDDLTPRGAEPLGKAAEHYAKFNTSAWVLNATDATIDQSMKTRTQWNGLTGTHRFEPIHFRDMQRGTALLNGGETPEIIKEILKKPDAKFLRVFQPPVAASFVERITMQPQNGVESSR